MWSDAARAKAVATKKRLARARKLAETVSKPKRRKVERPTKKATPKNYTGKYVKTAAWYADRIKRGMKVETSGLAQIGAPGVVGTTTTPDTAQERRDALTRLHNAAHQALQPDKQTDTFFHSSDVQGILRGMIESRLKDMSLVQLATVLERLD